MQQLQAVEIRPFKHFDISGGVLIEAFPSTGLAAAIAGTYIVESLKLDQIAAISSTHFPSVSIISAEKHEFPARIAGSPDQKIAVCLSEFPIPAGLNPDLAKSILSWSKKEQCSLVISSCGLPMKKHDNQKRKDTVICGVGSNDRTRLKLRAAGIRGFESGVISGMTGALLNEGKLSNANVVALVLGVNPEIPDARAAAVIVETIDKLLPQIHVDVRPLYRDAEKIENRLKALRRQAVTPYV